MREQAIEISSQVAVTRDNVALHIDGVLYIQVVDPYKASYGVESYKDAVTNLAQTTMRSEIGRLSLDSLFQERETLNDRIVKGTVLVFDDFMMFETCDEKKWHNIWNHECRSLVEWCQSKNRKVEMFSRTNWMQASFLVLE